MKTNHQINGLLKTVFPAGEIDELAIIQYCLKCLSIKAKMAKPSDTTTPITFEQFKNWVTSKTPPVGSVIVYDQTESTPYTIAILRYVKLDTFTVCAKLTDGDLDLSDNELPNTGYRKPTESELKEINLMLANKNLEWSNKYGKVIEKYVPKNADFIKIFSNNELKGYGILNEVDANGDIIMYCVKMEGEPVRYSLSENIGSCVNFQFGLGGNGNKTKFLEDLGEVGKTWNGYLKRIEPIDMRVEKGGAYWFVNEKFHVVTAHDSHSTQDKKRYLCGNYFSNIEDAYEFIEAAINITRRILCRPKV